jgi:hypothetical protein
MTRRRRNSAKKSEMNLSCSDPLSSVFLSGNLLIPKK